MLGSGRTAAESAVRRASPSYFAVVMATGIVSTALRQAGQARLSAVLLVIAVVALAVLVTGSALRAAAFPGDLRADLTRPDQAFTSFGFVAACDVLGARLAEDGHHDAAAALAAAALLAWLALSWLVPGRLATLPRRRPRLTDVGGSWYLWTVGTQSLVVAAASLRAGAVIEIIGWSAGVLLYLVTSALVATRVLRAGLRPEDPTAPYWVAMGAAAITALAAASILRGTGSPAVSAVRPALSGLAATFWALASCLIPPLMARSVWRHVRPRAPLRYRPDLWMIVFPAGMYATASMQVGTVSRLPLIHQIGTAAVWPAAVAWALAFAAMVVSPIAGEARHGFAKLYRGTINLGDRMKRYKFQALVTLAPSPDSGPTAMVAGKMRRMVVRGQHHETGLNRFFSALVTRSYDTPLWPGDEKVIVTVVLVGDDPRGYFDIGDRFALWTGRDLGSGVVTRRLFV